MSITCGFCNVDSTDKVEFAQGGHWWLAWHSGRKGIMWTEADGNGEIQVHAPMP